jgi:hypothetical protein
LRHNFWLPPSKGAAEIIHLAKLFHIVTRPDFLHQCFKWVVVGHIPVGKVLGRKLFKIEIYQAVIGIVLRLRERN